MRKRGNRKAGGDSEKTLFIARRFVPVLVVAVGINIVFLFIDPTKVHWIGAITGGIMAIFMFVIRLDAERKYPGR